VRSLFITISTILVLVSPAVYIHSIFRGETRPHRTTRFVLLLVTAISAWALYGSRGAGFWLALASTVQAAAVFAISIKRGVGGWARLDVSCLVLALIGIVVWRTTGQPIVGLSASILADFIGYMPAFVKTYKHPHTEDWRFFGIDTVAAVCSLAALGKFSALTAGYPAYIFLANFGMVVLISGRKKKLAKMV
jgi:hypothetical protein